MSTLIKSSNLKNAHLMDFFETMRIVSNFLKKEDLKVLKLEKEYDAFMQNLEALDESLLQAQKTGFTDKILSIDQNRDDVLIGLNLVLKGLMYFPDPLISDFASQVRDTIKKYGERINKLPQREESAVIVNLLQDFRDKKMQDAIRQLNLNNWLVHLEKFNNEFENWYLARSEKEAEFISGLTREQRDKMQDSFTHLCRTIEAYAFIEGEKPYQALANKINVEVAKLKQLAKARRNREDDKNDEQA